MDRTSNIYLITNSVDDDWYVGCTINSLAQRWKGHVKSTSLCPLLRAKIAELGRSAFHIQLLEITQDGAEAEARWYDFYVERGMGRTLNSRRPRTYPLPTPERNARISATRSGQKMQPMSDQHRTLIRQALQGRRPPVASMRRICKDCGMESHPGAMGHHFRKTGHSALLAKD